MSMISDQEFEADFADLMRVHHTKLPYHNFDGHVMSTVGYFESIADDLESKNVVIDRHLGRLALFGHDAGYHEDHAEYHPALGYATKEAYAALLAAQGLEDMSMSKPKIEIVSSAILATHVKAVPLTNLEKAVRLADIGNVSDDEQEFLRNMGLLIQEAAATNGQLKDTFIEHCHTTQGFLQAYLEPAPTFEAVDGTQVKLERHDSFISNIKSLSFLPLRTLLRASNGLIVPNNWR